MAGRWIRGCARAALAAALATVLAVAPSEAKLPEPYFTLYGPASLDGEPALRGTVTLELAGESSPAASCRLGSIPDAEGKYVLRVPIDSLQPRLPGMARPGETVEIYVDGLWAGRTAVGERGTFFRLPLEASSVHGMEFAVGPGSTPNPVASGGVAQLGTQVRDTRGHALTYAWSAICPGLPDGGLFSDASLATPTWRAPANLTPGLQACTVAVTVSDGNGLLETRSFSQSVFVEPHAIEAVGGPAGTPNPVGSGGAVAVSVDARDSYGHGLEYAWSAACDGLDGNGSFVPGEGGASSWQAPVNLTGADVDCVVKVEASDGIGGTRQWSFVETVATEPHEIRFLTAAGGRPRTVRPGGEVRVGVDAEDSFGHPLKHLWSASCPGYEGAGSFERPRGSVTRWTAPRRPGGGTGGCTITVRVSDGRGMSAESSFVQVVSDGRPVAVATATPASVSCPEEVVLSGADSYHPAPGRTIVTWEWDFDPGRGGFDVDATGVEVRHRFGEVGPRAVALRVTDDSSRPLRDVDVVEVTVGGEPPVASAGGPYEIAYGAPLLLDATASASPGAACANRIAGIAWDLDDDGIFDDAAGPAPRIGWGGVAALVCGGACAPGEIYPLAVRVTDRVGSVAEASTAVSIGALDHAVRLVSPNGGEMLGTGRTVPVAYVSQAPLTGISVRLAEPGGGERVLTVSGLHTDPGGFYPAGTAACQVPGGEVATSHLLRLGIEGSDGGPGSVGDDSDGSVGSGPLDVMAPDGGETIAGGSPVQVRWQRFATIRRAQLARIGLSLDGGATWRAARPRIVSGQAIAWRAPRPRKTQRDCRLMVELLDGHGRVVGRDVSEGAFTILGRLDVLTPEDGDQVYGGASRTVRWHTGRLRQQVARTLVDFSLDGGATWTRAATLRGNPGLYSWSVPPVGAPVTEAAVRVILVDESRRNLGGDQSEGGFTILPLP